jgi:hypothetical protein
MSKHQSKGVKQVVKGFLSGARKMVHVRIRAFLLRVLLVGVDGVSY